MRTQEEILSRYKDRRPNDFLNFECYAYLEAMDYEHVKPFLKEDSDITSDNWFPTNEDQIKQESIEYMDFAWEKANGERGISTSRSISHYIAWMWLLGYENTERWENYNYYGKPQLIEICGLLGLDYKQWDDGIRVN